MNTFICHALKAGLILAIPVSASGCALTHPVQKRAEGYTETIKDNSPQGWHEEQHEPSVLFGLLMVVTLPVDTATFPIQLPFVKCIWDFYDISP